MMADYGGSVWVGFHITKYRMKQIALGLCRLSSQMPVIVDCGSL